MQGSREVIVRPSLMWPAGYRSKTFSGFRSLRDHRNQRAEWVDLAHFTVCVNWWVLTCE